MLLNLLHTKPRTCRGSQVSCICEIDDLTLKAQHHHFCYPLAACPIIWQYQHDVTLCICKKKKCIISGTVISNYKAYEKHMHIFYPMYSLLHIPGKFRCTDMLDYMSVSSLHILLENMMGQKECKVRNPFLCHRSQGVWNGAIFQKAICAADVTFTVQP